MISGFVLVKNYNYFFQSSRIGCYNTVARIDKIQEGNE